MKLESDANGVPEKMRNCRNADLAITKETAGVQQEERGQGELINRSEQNGHDESDGAVPEGGCRPTATSQ